MPKLTHKNQSLSDKISVQLSSSSGEFCLSEDNSYNCKYVSGSKKFTASSGFWKKYRNKQKCIFIRFISKGCDGFAFHDGKTLVLGKNTH